MEAMRRSGMDKPTQRPMITGLLFFLGKLVELKYHCRTLWVSLMVPVDQKPEPDWGGEGKGIYSQR